jgi:predicted HicB family RNase H-like nuclease
MGGIVLAPYILGGKMKKFIVDTREQKEKQSVLCVRVDNELHDRAKKIANKGGISISNLFRQAIIYALDNYDDAL